MYYIYGQSGPSLLIESTDSMIVHAVNKCALYRISACSTTVPDSEREMEREAASNAAFKDRHQRKLCGHCNEFLSYSAYRSHKSRYYIASEQRWIRTTSSSGLCGTQDRGDPETNVVDVDDDPSMDLGDSTNLSMDEQIGKPHTSIYI